MNTKASFRRGFPVVFGSFVVTLLGACAFSPVILRCYSAERFLEASVGSITSSERNVIFEDPGTIIAYQGSACAQSDEDGTQRVLKVEQSLELPPYATKATVFLNGWHLRYLHGDQHVAELGTLIGHISVQPGSRGQPATLKWQAAGALGDKKFDNPYKWCYTYTAIAWNPSQIDLSVDQRDGSCDPRDHRREANFFVADNKGTTTALACFSSYLHDPGFVSGKTVAILPRGYGFKWLDLSDHHLLQLAYNLDHSEPFIESGKTYKKKDKDVILPLPNSASQVGSGYVSWETSAIFKDNDTRRDYQFGEMVSGLAGSEVGVIQPPFSILPIEEPGFSHACIGAPPPGVRSQEFVIENIPFEYALPMLTGWELGYACSGDTHVAEAGIWIDDIHYEKNPNSATGTLRYRLSSVLRDKDSDPEHYFRHKVTILGLRPTSGGNVPIPVSPKPGRRPKS